MKISQMDHQGNDKTLQDLAVNETVTLTTSSGRFSIAERPDGGLEITESGHSRLAIRPQVTNGIILQAERF
jgi:hypothetical protein